MEQQYVGLWLIGPIYKILSAIAGITALVSAAGVGDSNSSFGRPLIYVGIALTLYAFGAVIHLLVMLEEITRATANALRQQITSSRSQPSAAIGTIAAEGVGRGGQVRLRE